MSAPHAYRAALRRLRPVFLTTLGVSGVTNLLMLTGSIYMIQVYDRVLASGSIATLLILFTIVAVLYGFLALFDLLRARLLSRAFLRLEDQVGPSAFAAVMRPRAGSASEGQPLRDLATLRQTMTGQVATALLDLPFAPLFLLVLFLVHPVLGWLTLGGAGVSLGVALLGHAITREPMARSAARDAGEGEFVQEVRRGAEVIRSLGMGPALTRRWKASRDAVLAAEQEASEPSDLLAALSRSFRMLLQSAILTAGAWLVIRGQISAGMIIASSVLAGRALAPIDQVIGGWRGLTRARLAHRALSSFEHEAAQPHFELPALRGALRVNDLTCLAPMANGTQAAIMGPVSFQLEPGDGLAVIGPSGGGKTTLVRLLAGGRAPDRGEIRLDGATFDQWDPVALGRQIGYLPQAPSFMLGTVAEVIARHDPAITEEKVVAAAQRAGVHEVILSLPQGYDTPIGGRSNLQLSGGQIQRIALARAICGEPRLVILDEPNAHLDASGEESLLRAVADLRKTGSTVIMVTHRPSALAALNKVLVIEGARAVRFGPKEAIVGPGGVIATSAAETAQAMRVSAPQLQGIQGGRGPEALQRTGSE